MTKRENLVFRLEKQQLPHYEECENWLGFEKIEIIKFNYDGEGNALVFQDNELSYFSTFDLNFLIFGGWYSVAKNNIWWR